MGFNRRKMEDQRRQVAQKEAAERRATDAQILEDRILRSSQLHLPFPLGRSGVPKSQIFGAYSQGTLTRHAIRLSFPSGTVNAYLIVGVAGERVAR